MRFKNVFYQIFFRVCLLLVICSAICWFGIIRKEIIPVVFFSLILVWHVYKLTHKLNKYNAQINNTITSFLANDFSTFPIDNTASKSQRELCRSLNKLGIQLQKSILNHEVSEQLYQIIIEKASQAVVCFDESGKILVTNKAFGELINIQEVYHLNQLNDTVPELYKLLKTVSNLSNFLLKDATGDRKEYLINCNEIRLRDKQVKIVFLSNIKDTLTQKELESWTRLMRTIVHEIMNSVAPMTSLTDTLLSYYANSTFVMDEKLRLRTLKSLETIKERGEELTCFAESFRQVYQIPKPVLEKSNIAAIIDQVFLLFENEFLQLGIKTNISVSPDASLLIDKALFKNVLINLIRNATDSLIHSSRKILTLKDYVSEKYCLTISDTGAGIPPEIMDEVFTPFFTTKPKGTGIGLSLCRSIVVAHKGEISLESRLNKGTTVLLKFPLVN